jgi:hypothetical protein
MAPTTPQKMKLMRGPNEGHTYGLKPRPRTHSRVRTANVRLRRLLPPAGTVRPFARLESAEHTLAIVNDFLQTLLCGQAVVQDAFTGLRETCVPGCFR